MLKCIKEVSKLLKTKKAYAKINLTLDLTGVLPNGYHPIFTLMQTVSLCDEVAVEINDSGVIEIESDNRNMPLDMSNTAYKAAALFLEKTADTSTGVKIRIDKKIPSEAGLAGGSADAAAVLNLLNEHFSYPLSEKELLGIALKVGADVPFCVKGKTQLCQNIGEVMTELPAVSAFVVIAKPEEGVSTKEAFARFDESENISHPNNDNFLFYAARGEYKKALENAFNIFELLTPVAQGEYIKEIMKKHGAYYASMSGSGSAFFGLFDSIEDAQKCEKELRDNVYFTCVCETLNKCN